MPSDIRPRGLLESGSRDGVSAGPALLISASRATIFLLREQVGMEHLRDLLKCVYQPRTWPRNDIRVDVIDAVRRDSRDARPARPCVDLLRIAAVRWLFRQNNHLRIGGDDTLDADRWKTAIICLSGEDIVTASVSQHIIFE